jgi:hypothetical protein
MHCYKDYGGISYWVGDGFCDDINNNEACDYDDGDCCGLSMKKNFCIKCVCKGKSNSFKPMKEIKSIITFPQYLHAKLMRIAMEMVTAMPENANAPLIMSMPKIVQFLDVSSYSQSHYIEVPKGVVFSRAIQN